MKNNDSDDFASPARLLPSIAVQLRPALGNLHFAAAALVSAEAREKDPQLDVKAAALDQSYYQLLRIVDNLSAASYLQKDLSLPMAEQDLVAIVQSICDRSSSLAELLGLDFSFVCEQQNHVCTICADAIEQLLFQLLSNAFKFTQAGGSVTVELKFSRNQVLLSVTDTGCGIKEDLLPTLFDRYLHSDLMNPPPHGFGLGLPICRSIAEAHGGNIMAESKVGEGTCITLSIPDRQTGNAPVSDVPFDYAGGFNRTLLALSDALPSGAFRLREMD